MFSLIIIYIWRKNIQLGHIKDPEYIENKINEYQNYKWLQ